MKTLCETCNHSHVVKGNNQSQIIVRCEVFWHDILTLPFEVTDCDRFQRVNEDISFMKEIAHVLRKNGRLAGFIANDP